MGFGSGQEDAEGVRGSAKTITISSHRAQMERRPQSPQPPLSLRVFVSKPHW